MCPTLTTTKPLTMPHEYDIQFDCTIESTVEIPESIRAQDAEFEAVNRFLDDILYGIDADPAAFVTVTDARPAEEEDNER
jgi:hypothetical protein